MEKRERVVGLKKRVGKRQSKVGRNKGKNRNKSSLLKERYNDVIELWEFKPISIVSWFSHRFTISSK